MFARFLDQVMISSRKPVGRPRPLSPEALSRVMALHADGLGRAISSELGAAGIDVDWSTDRRAIERYLPYEHSESDCFEGSIIEVVSGVRS